MLNFQLMLASKLKVQLAEVKPSRRLGATAAFVMELEEGDAISVYVS